MALFNVNPPPVILDADTRWLLAAAFAQEAPSLAPSDPLRALELARATELSGRVARRRGIWPTSSSFESVASELDADFYSNVALELLQSRALARIEATGRRLGVPIILLKFAGLRAVGAVARGTRQFCDLDLLLPQEQARAFWSELIRAGFARTHASEYDHQLEPLVDVDQLAVDLHVHLPGVRAHSRGRHITAEEMLAHDLVSRESEAIWIPKPPLLAAHAISHALSQNLATPQSYSPLRMVSDIVDLRRLQPDVVLAAKTHVSPHLFEACDALEQLCASLTLGIFEGPSFDGSTQQQLLCHALAARLDEAYAERLRARGLFNKFRDGSSLREIGSFLSHLLYPGELELERLYGPAPTAYARLLRRLRRPVDLIVRAGQSWRLRR